MKVEKQSFIFRSHILSVILVPKIIGIGLLLLKLSLVDGWYILFRHSVVNLRRLYEQDGLAVASIARDDPSTLPSDDPFPRASMHRDRNAR